MFRPVPQTMYRPPQPHSYAKWKTLLDPDNPASGGRRYVLARLRERGDLLRFCPDREKVDIEYVQEAVHQDGLAIEHVPKAFVHSHVELQLAAVRQNGNALAFIAQIPWQTLPWEEPPMVPRLEPLRREVVLQAVAQNGIALKYATVDHNDNSYQDDTEVVITASRTGKGPDLGGTDHPWEVLDYASEPMKALVECRAFQRLLLATLETCGTDCQNRVPLVQGTLVLNADVREKVLEYLSTSVTLPTGGVSYLDEHVHPFRLFVYQRPHASLHGKLAFAWHQGQVPLRPPSPMTTDDYVQVD